MMNYLYISFIRKPDQVQSTSMSSTLCEIPKVSKFWLTFNYFEHGTDPTQLVKIVGSVMYGQYGRESKHTVSWKNITELGLDSQTIKEFVTINRMCEFKENMACYGFLVEGLDQFNFMSDMKYIYDELVEETEFNESVLDGLNWVMKPEPMLLICLSR